MKNSVILIVLIVALSGAIIAGCVQQQQPTQRTPVPTPIQSSETVKITDTQFGKILVDAQGKTLYFFAKDIPASGNSSCYDQCSGIWPVFSVDSVVVSPPLVTSDFSVIMRTDGKKQTTYRGLPLYYFQNDAKPGDMNGQGFKNIWFVANVNGVIPTVSTPTTTMQTQLPTPNPTTMKTTTTRSYYGSGY